HNALGLVREVRPEDAAALCETLLAKEMTRFTVAPPSSPAGFTRFIAWAQDQRAAGHGASFAIVPRGGSAAVGLIQVRETTSDFATAEWGFAVGSRHWGSGLFVAAAKDVLAFTFGEIGVLRLEARSMLANGRAVGALSKLGAVQEGCLRQSLVRPDGRH